jgi:hypothetical protein
MITRSEQVHSDWRTTDQPEAAIHRPLPYSSAVESRPRTLAISAKPSQEDVPIPWDFGTDPVLL